jgi:hypothetical protein
MDLHANDNTGIPALNDTAGSEQQTEARQRSDRARFLREQPAEPGYDPYNSAPPLPKRELKP